MGSAAGPAKQGHMPLTAIVLVVVSEHQDSSSVLFFFSYITERTKSETLRPLPFCFQMPSGIVIQRSVYAQLSLKPLPVTAVGILLQSSTTIAVPTAGSIPFDGNKRSRTFKSFSVGLTAPIFLTFLQELRWSWEFGRS